MPKRKYVKKIDRLYSITDQMYQCINADCGGNFFILLSRLSGDEIIRLSKEAVENQLIKRLNELYIEQDAKDLQVLDRLEAIKGQSQSDDRELEAMGL